MGDWVAAVVPAAGRGVRMGAGLPKQFLTLGQVPLLVHSLRLFEALEVVNEVILVVPESDREYCQQEILPSYSLNKVSQVVGGGPRRQDSVWNGLQAVNVSTDVAIVHDAVRPFITEEMAMQVIAAAKAHGAAIVAIPMRDTVKRVKENGIIQSTLNREGLWLAQTPQAFRLDLLKEAHRKGEEERVEATDDAFLVERLEHRVSVVPGSSDNIKITRPEDLTMGEAILNARMSCPSS